MSEDAVTFESARGEEREEVEEAGEEPFYAGETPVIPDREDIEERVDELLTILSATPEELSKTGRRLVETPQERSARFSSSVDVRTGALAQSLNELRSELGDATTSEELLNIIAESNILLAERLDVLNDIQLEALQALFDIVSFTSPFTRITVSGTNEIEDPDTAELVVPQSDTTSIHTRILFMRAAADNTDEIAIGDDGTEPDTGYVLDNGDVLVLNIDLRDETLWMASETDGQVIELLGLR